MLTEPLIIQCAENPTYCMGVTQASVNNTVILSLLQGAGGELTQWQLDASSGHIMLVVAPTLLLDIGGTGSPGSRLIVADAVLGRQTQAWNWLGNPPFIVNNADSGMVVDNSGSKLAQDNPIIAWPQNGGLNQQWTLLSVSQIKAALRANRH